MSKAQKGNKEKNGRRTRTSLRPMCPPTSRHKARVSRPSTRSRESPEARFGFKVADGSVARLLDPSHRPLGAGRWCILPSGHGARHEPDRPLLRSSIEQGSYQSSVCLKGRRFTRSLRSDTEELRGAFRPRPERRKNRRCRDRRMVQASPMAQRPAQASKVTRRSPRRTPFRF